MPAELAQRMRLILEFRQAGVTDGRLLAAIERTPREDFVAAHLAGLAWDDEPLSIAGGQTIPKPSHVARMLAALDVKPAQNILEIGTGSGWQSAILAKLAFRVTTLERRTGLARDALSRLARRGCSNVAVHLADGALGWPDGAPFDRIILNAAIHTPHPPDLLAQIGPGGYLVAPVGAGADQMITRVRVGDGAAILATETFGQVRYPPLEAGLAD
jgi:protein-L-isoaspartate(D-aspartate) O-methyltransferase